MKQIKMSDLRVGTKYLIDQIPHELIYKGVTKYTFKLIPEPGVMLRNSIFDFKLDRERIFTEA